MKFTKAKIRKIKSRKYYKAAIVFMAAQDGNGPEVDLADALSYLIYWAEFNNADFDESLRMAREYCEGGL